MPDGTIIRNVPAGITKAQLNAKLTKNGFDLAKLTTPKQKASAIENIPLVGGLIAPVADIPLSAVEGLSGTVKSISDVFGADNAVSDAADYVSKAAAALKSAGSREDAEIARKIQKDAEGKGVWEEVKAAARAFTYAPLENIASVAGSAAPFVAAGVATGGTGVVPIATMAGLGTASGVGTIKGAVYDAVYDEFVKGGASKKDAEAAAERAQEYGGKNMDQIALGGAIGALASATGFGPQIARTIGKNAAENVAAKVAAREAIAAKLPAGSAIEIGARRNVLGGAAKSAVVEAVPEAVQGGQEQLSQNLALQREGFDVDTWKGVAGQAASEGIASLFLGGYGGAREARAENREMLSKEVAQELDALPEEPTEEVINEATARFVQRGFSQEVADQIVEKLRSSKAAIAEQAAELEKARAERLAQVDADIGEGPDLSTLPPTDTEEQAAMQRMREAEFGPEVKPDLNTQIDEYTAFVDRGQVAPAPLVESIARQYVDAMKTTGLEGVVAPERMAAFSQFVGNEVSTIEPMFAEQAAPKAAPARSTTPTITPAFANETLQNDDAVRTFADKYGIDEAEAVDRLSAAAASPTGIKYSRGRPPSASTVEAAGQENLFGALPMQEENRLDKFEEIQQRKLEQGALTQEEREAENQARADEFDRLQQERAAKDEQYKAEFVKNIEDALRRTNPANVAYSVQVDETSPKPYRIVGPDGELFAATDSLKDLETQAAALDPYTTPPMAPEEIEADSAKPTVATSMVQELTAEIDAARERGEIDNNQRTELIRQLERPDAYDKFGRPQDNIAKAEEEARAAMSKFRNTTGVEAKAAEAELAVANEKLTKLVNNRMLNPIRSRLRSMSEMRKDEQLGAKIRIKEATAELDALDKSVEDKLAIKQGFAPRRGEAPVKYERVPGAQAGVKQDDLNLGVEAGKPKEAAQKAPSVRRVRGTEQTDEAVFGDYTKEEQERLTNARRELNDAKIDLAESRVSKYRKGEAEPGGAPKIVPIADLQKMVSAITAQWKSPNPVQVVGSILDIKDRKLRNAIMNDDALDAKGLVAPDGTIYLIADNLLSIEDAKAVLFHEALGHVGLEKLFRENLDSALIAMYKSNPKVRAETDKWRSENEGAYADDVNPLARAVEEVLAERSERGQLERSLFQKIAAIIRNFARRMGINIKISDGDVAAILSMAHDKVVRGDAESAVVKGLRYINVWHGSPHDFDRFTTDKIGSGEGAQVYGWGLYFTDTKQIAEKQYRDRLSVPRVSAIIDGKDVTVPVESAYTLAEELGFPAKSKNKFPLQYPVTVAMRELVETGGDLEAAIAFMNERYSHWPKQIMGDVEAKLREINPRVINNAGKLYNVELAPKEEDFLLWDKPITEQSDKVQAALAGLGFKPMSMADKALDVLRVLATASADERLGEWYGSGIYETIAEKLGSPKAASLTLLEAGIRGNKYLDGNSRGLNLEKPGYNYVMFADDDVTMVAKYSRSKATPEERKKVEDAAAGLSAGARRVKDTMSTYGLMDGIEEAADSAPTLRNALIYAEDTASPVRQIALKSMPSSGITNWLERKAPAVYKQAEALVDTVRKMNGLRVSLKSAGDDLVRDMEDFVRQYGSEALARAQFTNRINEVDFLAFKTVDEALAKHRAIKAIEDDLLSNSNNKAETRKLIDQIKQQAMSATDNTNVLKNKVKLSTPILAHMNSLTKVAIANDKVLLKVKQLAAMTQRIRDSYATKEELAKQKGGLKLYKEEREYHKDMFEARQALLDERIARGQGEEALVRIRDMRAQMMRELQSSDARQKKGDIFWDLDADLFDKEYFPALRDGEYWLRVEEDLSKGREEEFYIFESARQLAQARREIAKRLGENSEDANVFKSGNKISELQNTLSETDDLMQRVFDVVGKARNEYEASGQVDMRDLVDSVFQTWLMTTPERSARRHFMHAKLIAGFSPNTLANLQRSVSTNANELTKLAYAGQVRLDVKAIKDIIGDKQRSVSEQAMLGDFARELETRAEQEINPSEQNAFLNFINRSSFYYFLTSARTALTNFANIPMRVIPRFWREYGYVEGTAMWMKYMKMWDSLGRVKLERTNMRFGDYLDAAMPNVNGSNFVKNNADLQWAMKAGTERGILMTTMDTMVHNDRGTSSTSMSNLTGKAEDLLANVGKVMGFLFTGTENISRQATFYMAFELEMNKQKKENPTKPLEMRREAALQKAMRITDDTIGNFADWERPSITKGELTRGFFLFKMHPILQTKYMVGAFRDIIGAPLRGVARQATGKGKLTAEDTAYMAGALKEFSGVLMMAGLLGGVGALPFYTMMAHALAEGFDEEDDEDVRKLMGMDPRTAYDADIMFRRWLMEKMGTSDDKDVDFADLFIGGVPGALTNTEISSTVSLDLVNMWFREPISGDSLDSNMIATGIANIAGLSMATQFLRGGEALYEGDIADGLKKTLPAFFRSWVTAYVNETEGVKNRKGDTIVPKEDITGADTFRSVLGGRSLKLARWQDYYITASKNEKRIKGEKQDILDDLEDKIRSGDIKSKEAFREFWKEEVVPFNRTYPDADFVITEDTIMRSMKGRATRSARNIQGLQVSAKSEGRRKRAAEPFMMKKPTEK
jgi:hypothetical protein